jgi:hypothetical protein
VPAGTAPGVGVDGGRVRPRPRSSRGDSPLRGESPRRDRLSSPRLKDRALQMRDSQVRGVGMYTADATGASFLGVCVARNWHVSKSWCDTGHRVPLQLWRAAISWARGCGFCAGRFARPGSLPARAAKGVFVCAHRPIDCRLIARPAATGRCCAGGLTGPVSAATALTAHRESTIVRGAGGAGAGPGGRAGKTLHVQRAACSQRPACKCGGRPGRGLWYVGPLRCSTELAATAPYAAV